jgi:uncharacterized protein YkwD
MRRAAAVLLGLAVLGGCASGPSGTPVSGASAPGVSAPALLAEVNAARGARNLPALTGADALIRAAADHAADMQAKGYFAHTGPDGSTPLRRMRAAGLDACYAAETLAKGQRTEAAVVQAWTNSPDHAALMFSPNPTVAGTGRAGTLWVMNLARPC